jgi:hypothetical protein
MSQAGRRPESVVVISIPDWGVTPFGQASGRDLKMISRELDDYNAAAKAICERQHVAFVDITPVSRLAANNRKLSRRTVSTLVRDVRQWAHATLPLALDVLALGAHWPFQARPSACCSQLRIGGNHAPHCAVDSLLRVRELWELGRGVHAQTDGDLRRRPIQRAVGG